MRSWLSTFPNGRSAVAILLLRVIVGFFALGQGYLCLTQSPNWMSVVKAAVLMPCGFCVLLGFITPITSVLASCAVLASSTSWFALPSARLTDCNTASIEIVAISLALAMIGPGSLSLDARLFGRREIVIPPRPRPANSQPRD